MPRPRHKTRDSRFDHRVVPVDHPVVPMDLRFWREVYTPQLKNWVLFVVESFFSTILVSSAIRRHNKETTAPVLAPVGPLRHARVKTVDLGLRVRTSGLSQVISVRP